MRLYISRHGEAVGTAATDAERALTERGREALVDHWQRLKASGVRVSGLLVSPYLRAQQTADCIAKVYDGLKRQECAELVPEASPHRLLEWLLLNPVGEETVLVSHMPLVATLTGLLTEGVGSRVPYGTGSVACLDIDVIAPSGGRLIWQKHTSTHQ